MLFAGQVSEQDLNFDGKPDIIEFTATVAGANPVYGVKALLQFTYVLKVGCSSTQQVSKGFEHCFAVR